ncbi:hypothetical protein BHM03_00024268 [Ensete ventricosum]|nr:hypothetical protein BHM03_00024268 [Ensete ventricosum]
MFLKLYHIARYGWYVSVSQQNGTQTARYQVAIVEESDQTAGVDAEGDGRSKRERERGKEKARGRDGVVRLEVGQVRGRSTKLVGGCSGSGGGDQTISRREESLTRRIRYSCKGNDGASVVISRRSKLGSMEH